MRQLILALPTFLLTGCVLDLDHIEGDRFREDFHFTRKAAPGGRLSLTGFNGKVEIATWDRDEVDVSGTKYASSEARLEAIKVDVTEVGGAVTVRSSTGSSRHRGGVTFNIRVPKKFELERIETSNGAIRVEGLDLVRGNLLTSNGAVDARNTVGTLSAETSNGAISVSGHKGDARFRTSNGRIEADVADGSVEARSSNGKVDLRISGKPSSRQVRAETNNGAIEIEMDAARDLTARTSNSSITVTMPRDANAELRAYTSNSNISSDFTVVGSHGSDSSSSRRRLDGKIGQGGPVISLDTSNGSIRLRSR